MTATLRVIGLDLSLTGTGIAFPGGETGKLLSPYKGPRRLADLRDLIMTEVEVLHPDLVVVEGYSYGSAAKAHDVGELGGVIRLALWEARVRWAILPPAALKKYATGRGNATKPDMRAARLARTGVDERDEDKNDAWWLRQAGLCWFPADWPASVSARLPADYVLMPMANRVALAAMTEATNCEAVTA